MKRLQLLLFVLFFITASGVMAQSEEIEKCERLIKDRKYWKCLKMADKYYNSTNQDIFLLYKAGLLFKIQKHKKVVKKYPEVMPEIIRCLEMADPNKFPEDVKLHKLKQLMAKLFPELRSQIKVQFAEVGVQPGIQLIQTIYKIYNPYFDYLQPLEQKSDKMLHPYDEIDPNMRIYSWSNKKDYPTIFEFLKVRFYFSDMIASNSKFARVERAGKRDLFGIQQGLYDSAFEAYQDGEKEVAKEKLQEFCSLFNNESNSRENYFLTLINDSMPDVAPEAFYDNKLFQIPEEEIKRLRSVYDLDGFSDEQLRLCHTAYYEPYLDELNQDLFLFHNLVRIYPQLFNNTVRKKHYENASVTNNDWTSSLVTDLAIKPRGFPLYSNSQWYEFALYHAKEMGELGIIGHNSASPESAEIRKNSWLIKGTKAENCSYGLSNAQKIIMQLLIDDGVESKGHRRNILGKAYLSAGIATAKHAKYGTNTVLDYSGS